MKAVKCGEEFICFSFEIEDAKRFVNVSKVYWRLSCVKKYLFFILSD